MALKIDNTTGDLIFLAGQFDEVVGMEFEAQRVRDRLNTLRNEWFLDLEYGTPYLEQILGEKSPNMNVIAAIFKREVRKSLDLAELSALTCLFDNATRKLTVAFLLVSAEGEPLPQTLIL